MDNNRIFSYAIRGGGLRHQSGMLSRFVNQMQFVVQGDYVQLVKGAYLLLYS